MVIGTSGVYSKGRFQVCEVKYIRFVRYGWEGRVSTFFRVRCTLGTFIVQRLEILLEEVCGLVKLSVLYVFQEGGRYLIGGSERRLGQDIDGFWGLVSFKAGLSLGVVVVGSFCFISYRLVNVGRQGYEMGFGELVQF